MVHNTNAAYNLRFHVSSILILSKGDVHHNLIVVQYVITRVWASWNFFGVIVSSGSSAFYETDDSTWIQGIFFKN
jgi:hypothetical protein